jgi:fluoroquinolone resistance protein
MIPKPPDFEFSFDNTNPLLLSEVNENTKYTSINFSEHSLGDDYLFENCLFVSCKFNSITINKINFCSCIFHECEFILTKLNNTTLNGVKFINCKLMGINFSDCNDFALFMEFDESILDYIVVFGKNLKKTSMIKCHVRNSDFTETDFREADFSGTTFEKTTFHNCNLEKSDFRTSSGYEIDPAANKIKNAKFSLPEAQSFLGFLGIKLE